jgi:hypothetical protein
MIRERVWSRMPWMSLEQRRDGVSNVVVVKRKKEEKSCERYEVW